MTRLHKIFLTVLVASLALPIAAVFFLSTINMQPTLLPLENEVLRFSFRLPPSIERKEIAFDDLKNPISPQGKQGKDYPPIALAELAPAEGSSGESPVSLIVSGQTTKLAVIKGVVLKEGDAFQGTRVTKIEKNRVLLKNGKEEKWLMAK